MGALVHGARVRISSAGHAQDGRTGTVISGPGLFMGTWTVLIDGRDYGFWPSELTAIEEGVGTPAPSGEG